MNGFNPNLEYLDIYKGSPPQGLPETRQGKDVSALFSFLVPDPPRERPVGGGGIHRKWGHGISTRIITK
jgi:hypothetical protein